VRLKTHDQLTALSRFFNDVWATPPRMGRPGLEMVRTVLGDWADRPSEAGWDAFTETLRNQVGDERAESLLADLTPYFDS